MKPQMLVSLMAFAAFFGGHAYAQVEHPTTGAFYHTTEGSYFWYDCKLQNPITLECEFTFSSVRKKAAPEDWESDLLELDQNFADLRSDWEKGDTKKVCEALDKWSEIFAGESPLPEGATKKLSDMPEGQRADMLNMLNATEQLCENFSKSALIEVARLKHDKDTRTCIVYSSFDRQTFNLEGENTWVSVQNSRFICHSVIIERFERPESPAYNFWNFFQRRTITNPSEKFGEKTCRALSDETEYKFRWNERELFLNCDYIEFGL